MSKQHRQPPGPLRSGEVGRRLDVFMHGRVIAALDSPNARTVKLTYADDAREVTGGLSCSLPVSIRQHSGQVVSHWLGGLLPDRSEVLNRWRALYGIKRLDPYAMLWHVGQDVAGAAAFVHPETSPSIGGFERVTDQQIGDRLREIATDSTAWAASSAQGQFSLAGAQAKFALARTSTGWAATTGQMPSTHIFKPAIPALADQDLNEHLTMRLAASVGLPVAWTEVAAFDGERALVVTRFDRRQDSQGEWLRIHQEDTVQARGLSPTRKYEAQLGRDVFDITRLLRQHVTGAHAEHDVDYFIDALAFNWLVVGTDAHARNYSLLHSRTATRLAPLYDLNSYLPYRGDRSVSLSMRIGFSERDPDAIGREAWDELARDCRVDPGEVLRRVRRMSEQLLDESREVIEVSQGGWDSPLPDRLADAIAAHVTGCLSRLRP